MAPARALVAIDRQRSEFEIRDNAENQLRKQIQVAMVDLALASSKAALNKARRRLRVAEERLMDSARERQAS